MTESEKQQDVFNTALPELESFSLVLGGPLYQLMRRARLEDDTGRLVLRRILTAVALTWLPLLVLSAIEGTLVGGIEIPFLNDIETHARFLIGLPLILVAELVVHKRIRHIVGQFAERKIVRSAELEKLHEAVRAAMAWRNSIVAELILIALVYSLGYYVRSEFLNVESSTWFATIEADAAHLNSAGLWFSFVSTPLMQFLLLRWAYRILIWGRFLFRVSRLELDLIPTHPDRNGGLGFLGHSAHAFAPLLAALGAAVSGNLANRIFHAGASLADFKLELVLLVVLGFMLAVGPVLVFAPVIVAAKRKGLREYGAFAAEYTRDFDRRWLRSEGHDGEALLGSGDIQSLADLGNAYTMVRDMKASVVTRDTFVQLTVATLAPIAPLVLTMIPLEKLLERLIGAIL